MSFNEGTRAQNDNSIRCKSAAVIITLLLATLPMSLLGCASTPAEELSDELEVNDAPLSEEEIQAQREAEEAEAKAREEAAAAEAAAQAAAEAARKVEAAKAKLNMTEDYRDSFLHGSKGAEYQKYIMLHDTEGEGSASGVVDWWDSNGAGVAAHFIVNRDGSIVQCVPMDTITHHAGYGDTGHNELYGLIEDGRDDMVGTQSIGSWASDYGMNAYSIGIEMVHVGGGSAYTEAQLQAVDDLIAYIDAYYGFESEIIDHKAWRTGNSDTSPEFAQYLANYKSTRTHNG